MTQILIKCYQVISKSHRFDTGIDQALIFPKNMIIEEEKIENTIEAGIYPNIENQIIKTSKKIPYQCICCGYSTERKSNMEFHLFKSKRPCPKILNDIELTDYIRNYILTNRIYRISNSS